MRFVTAVCIVISTQIFGCATPPTPPTQLSSSDKAYFQCLGLATELDESELKRLQRTAKDRGVLLRIKKGDATGYLMGVIHLSRREWIMPGPQTGKALLSSDAIAFEINIFDPEIAQRVGQANKRNDAKLRVNLPPAVIERLERLRKESCFVKTNRGGGQKPTIPILFREAAAKNGLSVEYGLEAVFNGFARARKLPVKSLETVAQHTFKEDTGFNEQEILARTSEFLARLEDGSTMDKLDDMVDAWARGDLIMVKQDCPDCTDESIRQLNKRNRAMVVKLDKLLTGGSRVFASVGILHFVGPGSMQKELEAIGYTVERVRFSK